MSFRYSSSVCLSCRLRLAAALPNKSNPRQYFRALGTAHKRVVSRPTPRPRRLLPARRYVSTEEDKSSVRNNVIAEETIEETEELEDGEVEEQPSMEDIRERFDAETIAIETRKRFGDRVPQDLLNEEESRIYERLFGKPLALSSADQDAEHEAKEAEDDDGDVLLRDGESGQLEELALDRSEETAENIQEDKIMHDIEGALGPNATAADVQLHRDITSSLANGPESEEQLEKEDHNSHFATGEEIRAHPFTLSSRSGTSPSTIQFPKSTFTGPISAILGDTNNKHLTETAERLLGGAGLPYSTGTPRISRTKPQKPIPLSPFQTKMQSIEGDVYLGALMPGLYASISSILVECRRRLGTQWMRHLFEKEEGTSILDVGAGGAGVLAWREILDAEWQRLCDGDSSASSENKKGDVPWGKATVLTSSDALRQRSSILLENTTFLPRLPDYVHIRQDNPQRKKFDIIVASHNLWPLSEDYMRRQHVQNLWSMVNPDGGILIFQEKGVPRGFEAVADARQFLLNELMLPTASDPSDVDDANEAAASPISEDDPSSSKARRLFRDDGTIIAPCTTHNTCPMYRVPGLSRKRKDYCHFSQRYIRPPFQQNILGAKSRNHEDVEFSYVAVQRGTTPEKLGMPLQQPRENGDTAAEYGARLTAEEATDRAFDGYDIHDPDLAVQLPDDQQMASRVTASGVQRPAGSHEVGNNESTANSRTPTTDGGSTVPPAPETPSPQSDDISQPNPQQPQTPADAILTTPPPPPNPPNPFTLPRLVSPPLKRRGHVILDCCTPSGALQRWTVPRSFGKQAYRDARKAHWGDLWALGAKFRRDKPVRMGLRAERADTRSEGARGDDEDGDDTAEEGAGDEGVGEMGARGPPEGAEGKKVRPLRGREKARARKRSERQRMVEGARRRASGVQSQEMDG